MVDEPGHEANEEELSTARRFGPSESDQPSAEVSLAEAFAGRG
jgi:hypothetical protein